MSCLFISLCYFIPGQISADHLRHIICEYLMTNMSILDTINANDLVLLESNMSLDTYVNNMRSHSTWGGAIEIKCFCNIFNIQVDVVFNDRIIEFFPNTRNHTDKIKILYTGNHYEPVK